MKKKLTFLLGGCALLLATGLLAGCGGTKLYTITFDSKGGTSVAPIQVEWNQTPNMPEDPTKTGYTFNNWYEDVDYKKEYVVGPVKNDFTLYAKWDINRATITFNTNGGTSIDPITGVYDTTITIPETKKDYYTFGGWFTDAEFTHPFTVKKIPAQDITLYAKWNPYVTTYIFDKGDDDAKGEMSPFSISQDSVFKTLPRCTFTKDGYEFQGWAFSKGGNVVLKDEQELVNVEFNGDKTLFAVWDKKKVMVNFYVSGSFAPTPDSYEGVYGDDITFPLPVPTLEGYKFADWGVMTKTTDTVFLVEKEYYRLIDDKGTYQHANVSTGSIISGAYYEVKDGNKPYKVGDSNEFYARFVKQQYTIHFMNGVDKTKIGEVTGYYNEPVTTVPSAPIMPGYTFNLWCYDLDKPIKVNVGNMYFPSSDIVLYAKYDINSYQLTLVKNNDQSDEHLTYNYGADITKIAEPSKVGYTFDQWYLDDKLTQPCTYETMPAQNLTLYAGYIPNTYTITFNSKGGSDVAPIVAEYDSIITKPINPTKYGYGFDDWYKDEACTNKYVFATDGDNHNIMKETSNITVYAKWIANKHGISFDTKSDSSINPINNIDYLTPLADKKPADPTRTGYTFSGWLLNGEPFDFQTEVMGNEDITLVAKWTANSYTITFDSKGGSEVASITADYDSAITKPSNPTKTGYTFAGWYKDEALTNAYVFNNVMKETSNITLYAKWDINKHSITFNSNSGSAVAPINNVNYGTALNSLKPADPTRTGYTFSGWLLNGEPFDFQTATMGDEDITLVASWTANDNVVTIIYMCEDLSGGTYSLLASDQMLAKTDTSVSLDKTTATKVPEGFVFERCEPLNKVTAQPVDNIVTVYCLREKYDVKFIDSKDQSEIVTITDVKYGDTIGTLPNGVLKDNHSVYFYSDSDCTEEITSILDKVITSDTNIYVKYVQFEGVTFDANGGAFEGNKLTYEAEPKPAGTLVEFPNNPTRKGYTFVKWVDKDGNEVTDGTFCYTESAQTVKAVWSINSYSLTIVDGEKQTINSYEYGSNVSLVHDTPDGYHFVGWSDGSNILVVDNITINDSNLTLTAIYLPNQIKVTFHSGDGVTGSMNSQTFTFGDSSTSLAECAYRKVGHEFKGWALANGSSIVAYGDKYTFVVSDFTDALLEIDLYPVWQINSYTITFDTKGGSEVAPITADYGSAITQPADPTRTGYTFSGWFVDDGQGQLTPYVFKSTMDAANVTVVAKWDINKHSITFNSNSGSAVAPINNVNYGTALNSLKPADPTRTGYTFSGWLLNGEPFDFQTATMGDEDITLVANWTVNSYTITFDSKGGSEVAPITADYGSEITKPADPTKEGYTFDGWYKDEACTEPYSISTTMTETSNITIYAKWNINYYSIIFQSKGGSSVSEEVENTHAYNSSLEGYDFPDNPTKEGNTFDGWWTKDGSTTGDWGVKAEGENLANIKFGAGNLTLYAKWIVNTYTISYIVDGEVVETKIFEFDTPIEDIQDPTKKYESFVDWTDVDGIPLNYVNMPSKDLKFYALFAPYTINFYGENGELIFTCLSTEFDANYEAFEQEHFIGLSKDLLAREKTYNFILRTIEDCVVQKAPTVDFLIIGGYVTASSYTDDQLMMSALQSQGVSNENILKVMNDMGSIALSSNVNSYYALILKTALDLQKSPVLVVTEDIPNLEKEISEHNNSTIAAAYTSVLNSVLNAQNDPSLFMGYATYATVKTTFSRDDLITQGIVGGIKQQYSIELESDYVLSKVQTLNGVNGFDNQDYYNLLLVSAMSGSVPFEEAKSLTSARLSEVAAAYLAYKGNAYYPFSSDANKAFNGWSENVNENNLTISMTPTFITKMNSVGSVYTSSITGSSVTFEWNPVTGAYGYKVVVTVNGEPYSKSTIGGQDVNYVYVTDGTSYKVSGLVKGNVVDIAVSVLKKDEQNQLILQSHAYKSVSIEGDGSELSAPVVDLTSDELYRSYIQTIESDIGEVSVAGDYYYKTTNDSGVDTYILFTDNTYAFAGGANIKIVEGTNEAGAVVGKNSEGKPALITKSSIGPVSFYVGDEPEPRTAIVRPTISSVGAGSNLITYNTVRISTDTTSPQSVNAQYLGPTTTKENYLIGAAYEYSDGVQVPGNIKAANYGGFAYQNTELKNILCYNGFKFDVKNLSTSGSSFFIDRDYHFYKFNSTSGEYDIEVSADDLYVYDAKEDVFYFKATDTQSQSNLDTTYKYVINPKADDLLANPAYVNSYIPQAIKDDAEKMSKLSYEGYFELNEALNVFDDLAMKAIFKDKTTSSIDVHSNIKVNYSASGVAYVPHALGTPVMNGLEYGDVDIKELSAVMVEKNKADSLCGPAIWSITEDPSQKVFTGKDQKMYAYNPTNGQYCIKDAEWVQNFDLGSFKIVNGHPADDMGMYLPYTIDDPYQRVGDGFAELTVHGNYFTFDGSKLPLIRTAKHNTAGSQIATYEMQNIQSSIFVNATDAVLYVNNMTVLGNTSNVSGSISSEGTGKGVAEQMRLTSGGITAFRSYFYHSGNITSEDNIPVLVQLNGVNSYNSVIAFYGNAGIKVSYSHAKSSWANSTYGWCHHRYATIYDHSVIESSGGAAIHIDDAGYDETKSRTINPSVSIDLSTCYIENFVSGEEQWFKGYSMEVAALFLKSTINTQVQGLGYTIIQEKLNPVTGLTSECMNWIFFDKTDAIDNQSVKRAEDLGDDLSFGNYVYSGISTPFAPGIDAYVFTEVDPSTGSLTGRAMTQLMPPVPPTEQGQPLIITPTKGSGDAGTSQCVLITGTINQSYEFTPANTYLYFRQVQAPFGYIEGIVELFKLA